MSAQILDRTLSAFRIGDPKGTYPIFDAAGSTIAPGRLNTLPSPIIYASEHYSTAVLEKLVHGRSIASKPALGGNHNTARHDL
ncbi:RES domain-containing protein [Sinorhizobium terangae]|nr:RES domain-containing protein [Sinorhizobium terangae]